MTISNRTSISEPINRYTGSMTSSSAMSVPGGGSGMDGMDVSNSRYQMIPGLNLSTYAAGNIPIGELTSDRPPQVLWVANYVSIASNLTQMPLCLEVQTGGFGIVQNGAGGFNFLVVIVYLIIMGLLCVDGGGYIPSSISYLSNVHINPPSIPQFPNMYIPSYSHPSPGTYSTQIICGWFVS
jgi:hypothetical protein